MKSAAAALGPAASYLCTPEAHGNAPSPPPRSLANVTRGPRAQGQGWEVGAAAKTRGEKEKQREREKEGDKAKRGLPTTSIVWSLNKLPCPPHNTRSHTPHTLA